MIKAGTWVEIEQVVLPPEARAPNLPPDTARYAYVLRLSGFLVEDADFGDVAAVRSVVGREHRGVVRAVNPGYEHSFGPTVPELLTIGAKDER